MEEEKVENSVEKDEKSPGEDADKKKRKGDKGISFFAELVKVVLLALLIIIPVRTFIFQPFFVQGASMEPNFHDGEYLIVNELGYKTTTVAAADKELFSVDRFKDFERGDAIVFRYPMNPNQFFIKRIVGLPGEKVVVEDDKVIIFNDENPNGFTLDEEVYLPSHVKTSGKSEHELGENGFYVLGDNRSHSSDSRSWGPLSGDMIIGKVLLRAWPVTEFEIFN